MCNVPEFKKLPLFYRDVILSYSKVCLYDIDLFKVTILNQPLWGNKFITITRKGVKIRCYYVIGLGVELDLLKMCYL